MVQARRKHRTPPGTRLGTHKDKTKARMKQRDSDKRIQASLAEAREHQQRLDDRRRAEAIEERLRAAAQLAELSALRRREVELEHRENEKKRDFWDLGNARDLIRKGYSLESTIQRTGWPAEMLGDVQVGVW